MEPILVYRDNGRQVLKAIHLSVEALEADDNILIFPENPLVTDGYLREGVGEFFSGFVNIAREYYKKTSRAITFYAIFANKNERTLSFSKGITYDPSKPFPQEKKKITRFLHETMTKMSKGNHNCKLMINKMLVTMAEAVYDGIHKATLHEKTKRMNGLF